MASNAQLWFWRTLCAILCLIIIVLLVLIPAMNEARHAYQPKAGFIASYTPSETTKSGDWIDPDKLSMSIREHLNRLFGQIDPVATTPMTTWTDRTITGKTYQAWGGEFATMRMPIPALFADSLPAQPKSMRSLKADSMIAMTLRYWTVRQDGLTPPGRAHIAVTILTSPGTEVNDPEVLALFADVLTRELAKGDAE